MSVHGEELGLGLGKPMRKVDLLVRHGQVLTMNGQRHIYADGAIAIRDGHIKAIGPDRQVASEMDAESVRDVAGALIHPGFVDAHVHPTMDIMRGLVPESFDVDRMWSDIEKPFFAGKTLEEEYCACLLSAMDMVANGSTLFADTGGCFDLDACVRAINKVGMRGLPGYSLRDVHMGLDRHYTPTDQCLDKLRDQMSRYPFHSDLPVRCVVELGGQGKATDRLLVEAKALADEQDVPMIMHQSWGEVEVAESMQKHGKRPIEHLADLGILGPNLTLVHMIPVDDREIELVAQSGACVVHCPAAAAKHAMGVFRMGRFPEMLKAGITVALGSDGTNGRHDVPRMAYLAALMFKEVRAQLPMITAHTALEMATIHGARALGMQDEVGSLEVGKRADIVIHTLDRPEPHPRFDPVENLVYFSLSRTVDTVIVGGEIIYDHGQFTLIDADQAYARIDACGESVKNRIGTKVPSPWPVIE